MARLDMVLDMEHNYRTTMKKYIFLIMVFCVIDLLAQSTPTYTTNYRFRKWAQGANPTADSLNANWTDIDTQIKVRADSITVHRTGLNTLMDSVNAHRTALGTGSNMDLSTTQTAAGAKTFSTSINSTGSLISTGNTRFKADTVAYANGSTTINLSGSSGTFITLTASASDTDVDNISNGSDGRFVIITLMSAYTLTFKDGVDNLVLAGDFAMGQYDTLTLIYDSTNSKWIELGRSNN